MKIGFISPFPPPGTTHAKMSGVAAYSKNLIEAVNADGKNHILVFGNKLDGRTARSKEDNLDVSRCWNFGTGCLTGLAGSIVKERKNIDVLHVQYEVFLYGGLLTALLFPFLLLFARTLGVSIVTTIHQVVSLKGVNKEFLQTTGIRGNLACLKLGLYWLLKSISGISSKTIVHEVVFKQRLVEEYGCSPQKIYVIPHGIEEPESRPDNSAARKRLGLNGHNIILFFGYLAPYKGLETLMDAVNELKEDNYLLCIAGGEHPRLAGTPDYDSYISALKDTVERAGSRMKITGFVTEDDVPYYFSAADVLVLPYTMSMSSSGPLALCAAYQRPFLASESLSGLIECPELIFKNTPEGLREKIEEFFNNVKLREASRLFSESLYNERCWSKVGSRTLEIYRSLVK
jgi:glycosyltransferase involved in cell wall biosynthesis